MTISRADAGTTRRTSVTQVGFRRSFALRSVGRPLPPGRYHVETDEELILGVSFRAYRRVSTTLLLPADTSAADAREFVPIDPAELAEAQRRDASD